MVFSGRIFVRAEMAGCMDGFHIWTPREPQGGFPVQIEISQRENAQDAGQVPDTNAAECVPGDPSPRLRMTVQSF